MQKQCYLKGNLRIKVFAIHKDTVKIAISIADAQGKDLWVLQEIVQEGDSLDIKPVECRAKIKW